MPFECITPSGLTERLKSEWRTIQASNPALGSPYFCPEFTQAVGEVRPDVFIAIQRDGGSVVAFFPFQRNRMGFGRPVGGKLSDYHGVIGRADTQVEPEALLRASGLVQWGFDHVPSTQAFFAPYAQSQAESPIVQVGDGWEAYRESLQSSGSKVLKKTEYFARRLQSEVGPLRISHGAASDGTLDQIVAWKSDQYVRSGLIDVFSFAWTRDLLKTLSTIKTDHFEGITSELWAGDQLVAAHFGMRSEWVWHWWFPAYDAAYSKHSPGMVLLLDAIQFAEGLGVQALDMGKGPADYKDRLCNGNVPLIEGEVTLSSARVSLRNGIAAAKDKLRGSRLHGLLKSPLSLVSKLERRMRFR